MAAGTVSSRESKVFDRRKSRDKRPWSKDDNQCFGGGSIDYLRIYTLNKLWSCLRSPIRNKPIRAFWRNSQYTLQCLRVSR